MSVGEVATVEGANLAFAVFDDSPCWIMFPRAGSVECFFHVVLVFEVFRDKSECVSALLDYIMDHVRKI